MQKTKIEWCDYTINPVKGLCPVACPYCYARAMYHRFKWNPEIRFDGNALVDFPSKPSRIFVGSTMELFGDWIKPGWMEQIMALPHNFPQHTFLFLTKQPQNLIKFSPFPDNCFVGVSATEQHYFVRALSELRFIEAKVKFLSLEPLLAHIPCLPEALTLAGIGQVIIGAQSKPTVMPKIEWVQEIVQACDKAGVKVFLKDNLYDFFMNVPHSDLFWEDMSNLRQELPSGD